jgi:hypothetical protein
LLGRTFCVLSFELFASMACLAAYTEFGPAAQTMAKAPAASADRVAAVSMVSSSAPSPTTNPTVIAWTAISAAATPESSSPGSSAAPVTGRWALDLFDARGVRWQNPDLTACTAAATQMMLNMSFYWTDYAPLVADQPAPLRPQNWTPNITYRRQEAILAYERTHMTIRMSYKGADAHGWRNALNYYGWGDINAGVYRDEAYDSLNEAARATVKSIALYRKPVGILAWGGAHAQLVTGYRVDGEDPRTGSDNFEVIGVYLTDPLIKDGYRDRYVSMETWRHGSNPIRFIAYNERHSSRVDPIDHMRGSDEWLHRWVIIAPAA